jgi:hypothetical protein
MRDTLLGILLGFIGDVIGFVLYGLVFSWMNGVSFGHFYQKIFLDTELFRSQILTGALIVNILMFYILMRRRMDDLNKGVLIAILLTVIGIVYYYT